MNRNKWLLVIFLLLAVFFASILVVSEHHEVTKAYINCVRDNSLDTERQEAIEEYCRAIAIEGGYRE